MTRWSLGIIIALSLAFFFALLAGGVWLKRPFDGDDDIDAILNEFDMVRAAEVAGETWETSDWERAEQLVGRLESAWQKVQRRIQFSVQIDDLLLFSDELRRLRAAVEVRERPRAWESVRLMQAIWHRM